MTKTINVLGSRTAVALFGAALLFLGAGTASASTSLFGDATSLASGGNPGGAVQIRSDAAIAPNYGGINFNDLNGSAFSLLTNLGTDFNVTDDNCGGGAPRMDVAVTNGSNSGNISLYLGPGPNFNACTPNTWVSSGNLLDGTHTLDTSQLPGGNFYDTYAHALAAYGSYMITGIDVVTDGSWNATATGGDGEQTILIDNTALNSKTYAYTPTGTIEITKYACPDGTTVTRAANGVGGAVPAGCILQSGKTFGYVHGTQTDANAPFPELGMPLTAAGTTTGGVLDISNLPADGRYLVVETNGSNQQLPAGDILGLYCQGDGDTSGTNDNQELTFVPANATTSCVAYNKAQAVPMPVHLSPADGSTVTTAALVKIDWTDVTDPALPMTYRFESSHASTTNPDGSFTTPVYTSGVLTASEIPTPGTPAGVYYWHVRAVDNDGAMSPWTTAWRVTVDNTPPGPPAPPADACSNPTQAPSGYTLVNGTAASNTVTLAPFTMFVGHGGNDKVTAPDGNYIICTGRGNDTISIGNGDYTISDEGGNNTITTGNGAGPITTGAGNDTITVGNGAHTINAGGGNNTITTGDGAQNVTTLGGNDKITTGGGSDTVNAGNGNNTVKTNGGDDTIVTGSGNDTVDGGTGTDLCNAGAGTNTVTNCP